MYFRGKITPGHWCSASGNPVSSYVCFELFVRYAVSVLTGDFQPKQKMARLVQEHRPRGDRPTYWPAVVKDDGTGTVVSLLSWKGSGDLKTLAEANCLAFFPGEERLYAVGEEVAVYLI